MAYFDFRMTTGFAGMLEDHVHVTAAWAEA